MPKNRSRKPLTPYPPILRRPIALPKTRDENRTSAASLAAAIVALALHYGIDPKGGAVSWTNLAIANARLRASN